jgi:hypothetical protein
METQMNRARTALIAATLTAGAAASLVVAISPDANRLIGRTFAATPLSDDEIQSRLQAQGFSNVQNLQQDGNRVIVTATRNGLTGQHAVNPATGKVIRDNDDDDDD